MSLPVNPPPSISSFQLTSLTAPFHPHSIAPLHLLRSATITFKSTYTTQYDQAGILLSLTKPSSPDTPRKWIKAGIEYYDSSCRLSTVCCDNWADWSVASLPKSQNDGVKNGQTSVTIQVEREEAEIGLCMWVYRVEDDGKKTPLREICWIYADEEDKWELEVSAAVARPGKDADGELEATFEKFEVDWAKPQ